MIKGMKACAMLTAILMFSGCSLLPSETPVSTKTSTQRVTRGDLVLGLSADGSITLPVTGLDFAVSGIINTIYVSAGEMVKKGDVLAELDDTDLQLAYKTAQNNLDKALLAYDEAVATAEYNLKTESVNLESARQQLNTAFDDYSYQQSIENAALALERRNQEYQDTLLTNKTDEDAARLTLTRREAELAEAEAALAQAEMDASKEYDLFSYNNSIRSAQNQVDRMKKILDEEKAALKETKNNYSNDLISRDNAVVEAAEEAIAQAEQQVYNAQNNYDDAVNALNIDKENLTRYMSDEAKRLQEAIEAAQKNVETAQQSVDDAQASLENTLTTSAQRLSSAQQSIDDAQTAYQTATEELQRSLSNYQEDQREKQSAYELQSIKMDNMLNADSSLKNALYNIEDARNALEAAENDLLKTRITATIDGEVLNITKKEGEKVTENESGPGFFMGTGNTSNSFITIRDLSEIYMTANVPEGDIVGLSVGQKIRVAVDALGEEDLSATVYSISSIPNADSSGIITYQVIGVLDEFNPDIRDSMSVFLTFIKREIKDVLLIPNKSVFVEDGQQYVYVQNSDESLEKRAVTCGFSNGSQTEVKEGLEAGETVIVGKVNL